MQTVPLNCEVIDGEIVEIATGEPLVIPSECECDIHHLCNFPACQERFATEMRYYGGHMAPKRQVILSDTEAAELLTEFWVAGWIDASTLHMSLAKIGDEAEAISPDQLRVFLAEIGVTRCKGCGQVTGDIWDSKMCVDCEREDGE